MSWKNGALAGLALAAGAALLAPGARAGGEAPKPEEGKRVEIVRTFGGGAYLGVTLDDTTGGDRGAVVRKVSPDTPAAKAGLKDADVITRYDGENVRSAAHLARLVRETPVGRSVAIEVSRGGAKQTLQATLGESKGMRMFGEREMPDIGEFVAPMAPAPPVPPVPPMPPRMRFHFEDEGGRSFLLDRAFDRGPRKLGIRYQEIEGQLAKYFKLAGDQGVLVAEVEDGGPAAKAGMKAGDVILKFEGKAIEDSNDLRHAVSDAAGGSEVSIQVQREGHVLDLKVKLAGEKDQEHSHPEAGEST